MTDQSMFAVAREFEETMKSVARQAGVTFGCTSCGGSGESPHAEDDHVCPDCNGSGRET